MTPDTMVDIHRHHPVSPSQKPLLKFHKHIWNAYSPPHHLRRPARSKHPPNGISNKTHSTTSENHHPKLILKLPPSPTQSTRHSHPPTPPNPPPSRPPPKCKSGLWRFHPGGTKRAQSGRMMNEVQREEPCLQSTCGSCKLWHPALLEESLAISRSTSADPPLTRECTTRLRFRISYSRQRLQSILNDRERIKLGGRKGILKNGGGDDKRGGQKRVRFRHRVRCVFESAEGREGFRRVVEERQ